MSTVWAWTVCGVIPEIRSRHWVANRRCFLRSRRCDLSAQVAEVSGGSLDILRGLSTFHARSIGDGPNLTLTSNMKDIVLPLWVV